MKDYYGTGLAAYTKEQRSAINEAVNYEIFLLRLFIIWNFCIMFSGIIFVYVNGAWLTTTEMLLSLAAIWSISGLPFFAIRDIVRRRFSGRLPAAEGSAPPPVWVTVIKLAAGLFFGSWATHVMLIASLARHFELTNYSKKLVYA